jgi:hypothetical protein
MSFTEAVRRLALVLALVGPMAGAAQSDAGLGPCPGRGRMGGGGARLFDASKITTIQGQILEIQRIERGRRAGIRLTVASGSDRLTVHLGPDFWVDRQDLKLQKGDTVEVKGSRIALDGGVTLIAQEVRRGDEVLALRDENGTPLWRGQRQGRW